MENFSGAKVKQERKDEEEGACGGLGDVTSEYERAREKLRGLAAEMEHEASMLRSSALRSNPPSSGNGGQREVNRRDGVHPSASITSVKTPKYSGRSDWEAFHAQFELLAHAEGWSTEAKALQLALCLTDEALTCLLLLNPEDRHSYTALVGALQRRFGQCLQPELLRNELSSRCRRAGEPLRVLANDIESLTRRAYAHMPPGVQSELARDQFIRALSPSELRVQVQLQHPQTLQAALEMAAEREIVWGVTAGDGIKPGPLAVRAAVGDPAAGEKPAWAAEMTELIRAMSLQSERRPRPGPRVCWGCGQPGHLVRECPKQRPAQGNDQRPA